jgi:hypothetical protein
MAERNPTDIVQLSKVRMREGMRKRLARQAELNSRTLNGEITRRLEDSFARDFKKDLNTTIVEVLAGPSKFSAELLRWIAFELQANPKWNRDPEKMAERLGSLVLQVATPTSPLYPRSDL